MSDQPLLTIGYSTLADRLTNISPPKLSLAHEVLISVQNPQKVSYPKPSYDCEILESTQTGVAKSRNLVLENSEGKYLLFADDEIRFKSEAILEAIEYLEKNPRVDLVLARTEDTASNLRKSYPASKTALTRFNSAKAATYEMLVRVSSIRSKQIRFDEDFGAGVAQYLGDEYIFISDLLKSRGKAVFLPITIAIHPVESSGSDWGSERDLKARAAIFTRVFGIWAPIMRSAFYIQSWKKTPGFKSFFRFTVGY